MNLSISRFPSDGFLEEAPVRMKASGSICSSEHGA
jgi:hypothetical protein